MDEVSKICYNCKKWCITVGDIPKVKPEGICLEHKSSKCFSDFCEKWQGSKQYDFDVEVIKRFKQLMGN